MGRGLLILLGYLHLDRVNANIAKCKVIVRVMDVGNLVPRVFNEVGTLDVGQSKPHPPKHCN